MKLFYSKGPPGNFGDDLNPLVWYSQYPELFTGTSQDETVIGIGTLINDRAPSTGKLHVMGAGVGYHGSPKIDGRWNFVFLRGPQSCEALGLEKALAITDPAILVRRIFATRLQNVFDGEVSYMPHHVSCTFADWKEICECAGIQYLDPMGDVSETIHKIQNSRFVIAEAMHAAVVADALRVPWVAVKAYPHILDFKWKDWCESINVAYSPIVLPTIWDMDQFHDSATILKSRVKRVLISRGFSSSRWTPPIQLNNREILFPKVVDMLFKLKSSAVPSLSEDLVHTTLLERIEDRIHHFSRFNA